MFTVCWQTRDQTEYSYVLHTDKYFLNLVNTNQIWIVLIPNLSKKCNYNTYLIWFNKIEKRFTCVQLVEQEIAIFGSVVFREKSREKTPKVSVTRHRISRIPRPGPDCNCYLTILDVTNWGYAIKVFGSKSNGQMVIKSDYIQFTKKKNSPSLCVLKALEYWNEKKFIRCTM